MAAATGERAPAFTSEELEKLVDGVLPQYALLYDPPDQQVSAHQKITIWRAIAKDVQTLGVHNRQDTHCRKRREDISRGSRKTAEALLGMASQRRRGASRQLTPLMSRILAVAYPDLDGHVKTSQRTQGAPLNWAPPSQAPLNRAPPSQAPLNWAPPSQAPLNWAPSSQAPLNWALHLKHRSAGPFISSTAPLGPSSQAPLRWAPPSQAPLNWAPSSQAPLNRALHLKHRSAGPFISSTAPLGTAVSSTAELGPSSQAPLR
ncbi:hypothetical protein NDU88_004773 [Pleurodeles waltl]|uniref:Myb/SANT-like DNA-binding domain-containing protein n=1 Tax=Pleurodeles waltl TaxID=8319 RepID=A0AAV7M9B1_PLEWA|nr:hypothetical protein NDU88_004773 [Pleurodeles waltl]